MADDRPLSAWLRDFLAKWEQEGFGYARGAEHPLLDACVRDMNRASAETCRRMLADLRAAWQAHQQEHNTHPYECPTCHNDLYVCGGEHV